MIVFAMTSRTSPGYPRGLPTVVELEPEQEKDRTMNLEKSPGLKKNYTPPSLTVSTIELGVYGQYGDPGGGSGSHFSYDLSDPRI